VADPEKKTDPSELDPDVLYSRVVDFQRRVATNMNDLQHELNPKVVAANTKESVSEMIHEPDGSLKTRTLVIVGAAVGAVVLLIILKRKK